GSSAFSLLASESSSRFPAVRPSLARIFLPRRCLYERQLGLFSRCAVLLLDRLAIPRWRLQICRHLPVSKQGLRRVGTTDQDGLMDVSCHLYAASCPKEKDRVRPSLCMTLVPQ